MTRRPVARRTLEGIGVRAGVVRSALLLALAFGGASTAAAQEDPTRPVLRGRVVDAETRAPLSGAFVMPFGGARAVVTDSLGLFRLTMELAPSYPLTVEQLGYATVSVTLPGTASAEFTTILLPPNPLALEGLTVLVDRFERRRRFHFGSVQVLDQDRLRRSARPNAYEIVRAAVPFARPCFGVDYDRLCTPRRGSVRPVDVCLDDVPLWSGIDVLEAYDPAELYLVEVYDRGQEIRIYTRYFVEERLRTGRRLAPLSWGCGRAGG